MLAKFRMVTTELLINLLIANFASAQDGHISHTGSCNFFIQGGSNNVINSGPCSSGLGLDPEPTPPRAESKSVQTLYFEAERLIKDKKYAEAVPVLEDAANQGEIDSQIALGILYTSGIAGIPSMPNKAFKLFELAANQGNAIAIGRVALSYLKGQGVKQDIDAAIRFTELGIKHGDALSFDTMGYLIENGIGSIKVDPCQSVVFYQKSSTLGSAPGKVSLAAAYLRGTCIKKNNKHAYNLLLEAAAMGNPDAIAGLKLMQDKGLN